MANLISFLYPSHSLHNCLEARPSGHMDHTLTFGQGMPCVMSAWSGPSYHYGHLLPRCPSHSARLCWPFQLSVAVTLFLPQALCMPSPLAGVLSSTRFQDWPALLIQLQLPLPGSPQSASLALSQLSAQSESVPFLGCHLLQERRLVGSSVSAVSPAPTHTLNISSRTDGELENRV